VYAKSPIKSASSASLFLLMNPSVQPPALSPKILKILLIFNACMGHKPLDNLPFISTSTATNGTSLSTPPPVKYVDDGKS